MLTEKMVTVKQDNTPKILSAVLTVLISVCLNTGFILMYSTAFDLKFNVIVTILTVLSASLIFTVIHYLVKPKVSLGIMAGLPVVFLILTALNAFKMKDGFKAFLYYIQTYAFYKLPGMYPTPDEGDLSLFIFALAYMVIAVCVTSYLLIKRKLIPVALLPYLPFFLCSVANIVMTPSQVPSLVAAIGVFMLLLTYVFRRKNRGNAEKELLIFLLPVVALTFLFGSVFPEEKYDKNKLAVDILTSAKDFAERATRNSDNPLIEMINNALNGYKNPYADSNTDYFSPLFNMNTNLSKVGPFNPPQDTILEVIRYNNTEYDGPQGVFSGHTLYLKLESLDTYSDNTLTSSRIWERIYEEKYEPKQGEPQYFITINKLKESAIDISPYYTDFYPLDDNDDLRVNPYNSTHEYVSAYAASSLPVKTGNIYTESYLKNYVYDTCLKVPKATERAVLVSDNIPAWFKEVYYGHLELSDAEKVRRVTDFVRDLHPYDANTEYPPEGADFVPWFLSSDAESGICIHYAATSMILLRMIGVPARYVRGYVDNRSYSGTESLVYASQAHAWFEVFLPEYGWVMGDATPGYASDASHFNIDGLAGFDPAIESAGFSIDNYENTPPPDETDESGETSDPTAPSVDIEDTSKPTVITPTPIVPGQIPGRTTGNPLPGIISINETLNENEKQIIRTIITIVIVILALCVLAGILRLCFIFYWRREFSKTNINEKAASYYHYYSLIGKLFNVAVPKKATDIALRAAFGNGEITPDDLKLLKDTCRNYLNTISGDFSGYKKFLYRFVRLKV